MNLVTVFRAFSPAQAQIVRSRLEAAEFHVSVAHELAALTTDGYTVGIGGILVQVPETEAEDARALLDADEHAGT